MVLVSLILGLLACSSFANISLDKSEHGNSLDLTHLPNSQGDKFGLSIELEENSGSQTQTETEGQSNSDTVSTSTETEESSNTTETNQLAEDSASNSTDPDLITCPSFTCSTEESSECLELEEEEEKDQVYTLHPCPSNQTCDFSQYNLSSSTCTPPPVQQPYQPREYGNSTYACNTTSDCPEGNVCFNEVCKHKRTEDSYCSLIDHCEAGTICNEGRCIEYFTVKSGEKADYSIACESGILLNATCQDPELTNGDLPKTCKKHLDCLASDGKTPGTCVCVLNEQGTSYCKLHRSDQLALQHLKHSHEGNKYNTEYYTRVFNLYPLNLFAENCFYDQWNDLQSLKNVEEHAEKESLGLVLLFTWFGAILVS